MGNYYFCIDCEHITTRMVSGVHGSKVKELSCPARFDPMQGKWISTEGKNPHECPRHEAFMQLQKQSSERRLR
jgi:predicted HAD superfamily Cof-like phosphohydrolase